MGEAAALTVVAEKACVLELLGSDHLAILLHAAKSAARVCSGVQAAVADEGAGEARKGSEVLGLAFVAAAESAAAGEPGLLRSMVQTMSPESL